MTAVLEKPSISSWMTLLRLPFTTVAVLPFAAGVVIAYRSGYPIHWTASSLGLMAVLFICITCYLLGEIYDREEDLLTLRLMRTKFSGGTLLVANQIISTKSTGILAMGFLFSAAVLGLYVSYLQSSWLLLGFGVFGSLCAVLYSVPPVRLVKRGIGEIFIGICYGWLTLVTGIIAATGNFPPNSYLFVLPQALSIFNVILFNEFPDYEADRAAGKRNLAVRLGKPMAARLYGLAAFLVAVSTLIIWHQYRPESLVYFLTALPVVLFSLALAIRVGLLEHWRYEQHVEPLCGQGILLNLLVAATLAFLVRM